MTQALTLLLLTNVIYRPNLELHLIIYVTHPKNQIAMKEFDYDLDYKKLDFTDEETRKLYRIGRGEQGVLLVRPYTNTICNHWRFKTPREAIISSNRILRNVS